MNLLKKKNLEQGEVVLYQPVVHWCVLLKPLLGIVFYIILLLLWAIFLQNLSLSILAGLLNMIFGKVFFIIGIGCVLYFLFEVLKYIRTRYYLTNKRLILKKGVWSTLLSDIPIEKIEGLFCSQGLWGKLFNYGTILVSGVGGMRWHLKMVRRPYTVRRKIYNIIEKNKKITIIREENPKPDFIIEKTQDKQIKLIDYGIFVTSYPAKK
ncbi:PH domain-containing protein [Treponema sp. TIM-1]|uniref:PH domain-containing protein n=1 Tax=Treponema sp. TIM-1 TaxID=2898417 RepID=UPI00397FC80E